MSGFCQIHSPKTTVFTKTTLNDDREIMCNLYYAFTSTIHRKQNLLRTGMSITLQ